MKTFLYQHLNILVCLHTIAVGTQQPRGVTINRTITHKHLKRQFDIFNQAEEFDNLLFEIQFQHSIF